MKKSASSAMMSGWVTVAAPAHDHVLVEECVGQGVLDRREMALGELRVANPGEQVLVGPGEEPDERTVIERAGLAGIARRLRLDPVEQRRRQVGRDGHVLLEQVAGHHRARGPEVGADVAEQDPGEHPPRLVVVDHHVRLRVLARPTPGVGLSVDHDDRRPGRDRHRLDRLQGDRDRLDHHPVLGPGDHPVDRQHDFLARLAVRQQRLQAEHARQRIGVRIDVRDHHDSRKRRQRRQQTLRAVLAQQEPVRLFDFSFGRHLVV